MPYVLETARLTLRPLTVSDVDNLLELDADPEVMRYLSAGPGPTRHEIRDEVLPWMRGYDEREPGYGFWAAEATLEGDFLGWFELRPLPDREPGEAELGYRLRRSAWGKGYATEGAAALVWAGFTEFGVRRVLGETMTINARSRRVLEKIGLRFVRTFHESWHQPVEGAEHGDVQYALTGEEWASSHGPRPELRVWAT
ncbi:GNAT family N-acetyltransferase [Amycolatopsis marina]|uniref:GNAT family N-acetyltransferase n=1 Tax=Amycolatopsis marina TaxID=490629 RepID=UPI000B878ECC|nr:GNAT family N-acetyltransferase [Amycolatopsis marina]